MNTYVHGREWVFFSGVVAMVYFLLATPAFAAELFTGSGTVSNSAPYTSDVVDTTGHENITATIDYNAEILDAGDGVTFTLEWNNGADSSSEMQAGVSESGANASSTDGDETGTKTFTVPAGVVVTDVQVLVSVAANTDADTVELTNVTISGEAIAPPACTPQFNVGSATSIQNTATSEYFNTLQDAINDCDTLDGHTIVMSADVDAGAQTTVEKAITLNGNGFTLTTDFVKTNNDNNSAIGVQNDGVTIKNLTLDGVNPETNMLHGINFYSVSGGVVDAVTAKNFRSGILVGGSTVTARDITTAGNIWSAINVDTTTARESSLTIKNTSTQSENSANPPETTTAENVPHIFVDDVSKDVTVTDADGQYLRGEVAFRGGTAAVYTLKPPVVTPEPVEPEENESSSSSYSSGTRTRSGGSSSDAAAEPVGRVLGVSTTPVCPLLKTYMQMGQANDPFEVKKLQLFLAWKGYDVALTGVFDAATDAAVRAYQEANRAKILDVWEIGLAPTGYVYKTTQYQINSEVCGDSVAKPAIY